MLPSDGASITAVIVRDRTRTRRVDALDLSGNERELPTGLPRSYDHWLAALATFEGPAAHLDAIDAEPSPFNSAGTAALAIGDGRLVGIVSPHGAEGAAVWLAIPLARLQVTASGRIGLLKKRPEMISVQGGDWMVTLQAVARYYVSMNSAKAGQEAGLLAMLGG